jgi:hypothetical protein
MFFRSLLVLLAASIMAGCFDGDRNVETQTVTEMATETIPARRCYRNEFPFEGELDQMDVQSLTIEIDSDRAVGEYNWLPAFKDRRLGRFEGALDGQSVTASYEYTQEGQSGIATISITLESDHVVVEGGSPELGLDATIEQVDC